ncbi:hypothetical protein F511_38273 [Dorcoceras hygrometricum]|uniref:Uncharacterized protein n=1 Tax=Dorcoceras hygrometricum TaxID=472368 RepID=A0A2Z6ZZN9_9LAMI|nr:hypothetical protein F511_38273 [Dorcoceras hygrometricum]
MQSLRSPAVPSSTLFFSSSSSFALGHRKSVSQKIRTTTIKSQHLSLDNQQATMADTSRIATPKWAQRSVTIPAQRRGCHLITSKILKEIGQDLSGFNCGLAHFFLQHTSASLTVNENYDSDVRHDTETFLSRIVPEGPAAPWEHTIEGPDDMPAHIKSSMFGCSLSIPITGGKLNMGTWQGIWLCEHRDSATPRKIVVTLNGI